MTPNDINDLLADYLGNELDPTKRKRFEDYLAADPAFAEEVAALRRTLAAIRSLDQPADGKAMRVGRRFRVPVLLRYAAVVLFAFAAGYAARSLSARGASAPAITAPQPDQAPASRQFERRFAEAYGRFSGGSDLARSLIALSRATRH